eukprot:TRINITY_DN18452_c0_g1_i1.p1 TRINITY_DN18452_c0_g1~~TRINITY_DN18452_c0_g1_i1.p1  ORF type:complete len:735 (-),score=141.11 TRINITY_DN18452_c0_g1_i1:34-2148(-)
MSGEFAPEVEERLRELEASGCLTLDLFDEHAQALLRKCDPAVALDALAEWERKDMRDRRNPSACIVSLLKRHKGSEGDVGNRSARGHGEEDDMAKQQAEELLDDLGEKLDANAREAVLSLAPHKAVGLLSDLSQQLEGVRNPSAFIISAVKRIRSEGQDKRGNGYDSRKEARREVKGGAGRHSGGNSYDSSGYDRGQRDSGYSHNDRSYQDHSYDKRGHDSGHSRSYNDRGQDQRGYDSGSYGGKHSSSYDSGGYGGSYSSGGRGGRGDSGRGDVYRTIDRLLQGLKIDAGAQDALRSIDPEDQVIILEDLWRDGANVRNPSAVVIGSVKRAREGTLKRRIPQDEGESNYRDPGYERGSRSHHARDSQAHHRREPRESRSEEQDLRTKIWYSLDEKAQGEIQALSERDADAVMNELESKGESMRNPSAFACSIVKRFSRAHAVGGQEDAGSRHESYDRGRSHRSRSPRRDSGHGRDRNHARSADVQEDDGVDEDQRAQVIRFVKDCDLLDQDAKDALCSVDPLQALEIMQKIAAKGSEIRNHSAFVFKACRDMGRQGGREPNREDNGGGDSRGGASAGSREKSDKLRGSSNAARQDRSGAPAEAVQTRRAPAAAKAVVIPADWRSMDLLDWLNSVDNGKGFLLAYENALLSNYDTLEQVMELYVTPPGEDGRVAIDQMFFDDLKVDKVGHKRLFEKWFKDRMCE